MASQLYFAIDFTESSRVLTLTGEESNVLVLSGSQLSEKEHCDANNSQICFDIKVMYSVELSSCSAWLVTQTLLGPLSRKFLGSTALELAIIV